MASQSLQSDTALHTPTAVNQSSGLKIAINQVEYSNAPDGPVIHIFGRDVTGKAVRLDVTGFRPYFYVPADQAEGIPTPPQVQIEPGTMYSSIRGEPLRRLYTQRPTDVRDVRERYRHFEADIPFATRYMMKTRTATARPSNTTCASPASITTKRATCITTTSGITIRRLDGMCRAIRLGWRGG